MKLGDFIRLANEMAKAGKKPMVERHIIGRMGPVLEAKALGFGTREAMIKLHGGPGGWVTVDPLMCKVFSQGEGGR